MSMRVSDATTTGTAGSNGRHIPAYGPVDAVLSYVMFYLVFTRATPTFRAVLSDVLPGISPEDVGFALAVFMWFVLIVSGIDQVRRQLAAVGIGHHSEVESDRSKPAVPSEPRVLLYLVGAIIGSLLTVWTFEPGVETAISLIEIFAGFDLDAFDLGAFTVMIIFFIAYGVVTWTVDRLVIGGIRAVTQ